MFNKILVANRGEIAVRIIRACRELGVRTVAVYAKVDGKSLHVQMADEAYCIGESKIQDSYLHEDAILQMALSTHCEAIHPGYGLLSENANFAKRVEEEGLVFIGPKPAQIELLGDKEQARQTMARYGVPITPGANGLESLEAAIDEAKTIGYPVLLKAAHGGGGKGIKLVEDESQMEEAWNLARMEGLNFFKDDALYMEKYLSLVKHVEVQVLGDLYGNVRILGERDCSLQRRNQKLIEESPCAVLDEKVRENLFSVCQTAMENIGYVGAGTLEFLLDENQQFYFMEANTRLQVEHPVTEFTTGVDLVKWQIRIACGVSIEDMDVHFRGHAIECRILAENPDVDFAPDSGDLSILVTPGGPFVRFDTYVYSGYTVLPYYDSLLGKLIVWDETRDGAIRKMKSSLGELIVEGIHTTSDFYIDLLGKSYFVEGNYTTKELTDGTQTTHS